MEKLPFNHGLIAFQNAVAAADAGGAARARDIAEAQKAGAPSIQKEAVWLAKSGLRIAHLLLKIAARLTVKGWRAFIGADDVLPKGHIKCSPYLPIWANKFLGTYYDPSESATPAPKGWNDPEPVPNAPRQTAPRASGKIHYIRGRRFLEADTGDTSRTEWVNLSIDLAAANGRSEYLTDFDRDEIAAAGLNAATAEAIKPLWAEGLTNTQIFKASNPDGQRIGFGQRSIDSIVAAFSRALFAENEEG